MTTPFDLTRDEFRDVEPPAVVRLVAEVDAPKPLAAYSALRTDYSFLLESAEMDISAFKQVGEDGNASNGRARYSFVGFAPDAVFRSNARDVTVERLREGATVGALDAVEDGEVREGADTLDALRSFFPEARNVNFETGDRQVFAGGLVGFLAYDVVGDLWLDEPVESGTDDAVFVLSTRNLVYDHEEDSARLVFTPVLTEDDDAGDVYDAAVEDANEAVEALETHEPREAEGFEILDSEAGERDEYEEAVEKTREHVYDGDIYQAVISRKKRYRVRGDARDFYARLREINPSPYMYLVEFDGFGVVGSSPETLVSVHDGRVTTNPIAGTCPRGETPVEDRRLAGEMLSDEKELAEHVMLVDLGRNDVRRVGKGGTVEVDDFMSVVQYSHVQHIESTVSAELRDEHDSFDATRAVFPAGTLSGAPKIRAMEIIDELEREPRGAYGGGVGYYSWNGDSDFAITIRTATFDENEDGTSDVVVQAGAGIVADSVPSREFDETEDKTDALVTALESLEHKGGER
ncbi:MAG: anthranilate synthase component I [Halobacteriales archaeon]|nr:anthranilate synthase component I [Halobacteriales archaeon]